MASTLRFLNSLAQRLGHSGMDARHQLRPTRIRLVIILDQTARVGVQRTVRVRLDEQTPDHHQHVAERELSIPVPLQRLHAHATGLRVDVGMEDGRAEVRGRRVLGVVGGDVEVEFEDAGRERGVRWAGEEDVQLGQVVGVGIVGREEVVWRERLAVQRAVVCCQATEGARVLEVVNEMSG